MPPRSAKTRRSLPPQPAAVAHSTAALDLPHDLLVALAQNAPTFVAMLATCKSWQTALMALSNDAADRLWRSFAVARFPSAAALLKHLKGPIAGKEIYRKQLQAAKAQFVELAPPPPCKTAFSDYLFTAELNFPYVNEEVPECFVTWSGCLYTCEDDITEWGVGSGLCEFWALGAEPEWMEAWKSLDRSTTTNAALHGPRLRVCVTKLATLECLVLCDDEAVLYGDDFPWLNFPTSSRMRLNEHWGAGCFAQFNPNWHQGTEREEHPPWLREDGFGRVVTLDFDVSAIEQCEDADDTGVFPESLLNYIDSMRPIEVLRYLEHYAPWHLNNS